MKVTIALAVLCALACAALARTTWDKLDATYTFEKYEAEFNKRYQSATEREARKKIFLNNLETVLAHNNDPTKSWKMGVNHLSDRTDKEFRKTLGYNKRIGAWMKSQIPELKVDAESINLQALPKSKDWRKEGVVSDVKDQGQCGSCWTFGTAETIESHWALKTGQLTDMSQQQILDCTPNPSDCGGTGGCGGGTPELAYAQIIKMGGLTTEWMYSYQSYWGTNNQCSFSNSSTVPFGIVTGFTVLPSNQYAPVMQAIATVGPLAINVDASAWQPYEYGVFDGCNMTNPDIDHVVQLVGYGSDPQYGDYWLIRNSWSPVWGEEGYIRLRRSSQAPCGWDIHPQDGTGCNGGPSKVKVCVIVLFFTMSATPRCKDHSLCM